VSDPLLAAFSQLTAKSSKLRLTVTGSGRSHAMFLVVAECAVDLGTAMPFFVSTDRSWPWPSHDGSTAGKGDGDDDS
jgi:hypothetical protein